MRIFYGNHLKTIHAYMIQLKGVLIQLIQVLVFIVYMFFCYLVYFHHYLSSMEISHKINQFNCSH